MTTHRHTRWWVTKQKWESLWCWKRFPSLHKRVTQYLWHDMCHPQSTNTHSPLSLSVWTQYMLKIVVGKREINTSCALNIDNTRPLSSRTQHSDFTLDGWSKIDGVYVVVKTHHIHSYDTHTLWVSMCVCVCVVMISAHHTFVIHNNERLMMTPQYVCVWTHSQMMISDVTSKHRWFHIQMTWTRSQMTSKQLKTLSLSHKMMWWYFWSRIHSDDLPLTHKCVCDPTQRVKQQRQHTHILM